jgi:hypothetical protein
MSTILPLALFLAAQAAVPQEPPVTTGSERGSAVRLQLSGHLDLHYLHRSSLIDDAGSSLNGLAPAGGPTDFWSGRIGLRADIEVKDLVTGVLEIENRSFEKGMNKPFSASPPDTAVQIRQGYIEAGEFLTSQLNLRIGIQNVTLRNRPQEEAFFMDLGESEGFFKGFQAGGSFISNTVDRDVGQATGVRLFYSPFEVMTIQAFWMVYGEGAGTPLGDSVYAVLANSLLAENWSAWLLFAVVSGQGPQLGEVGTLGFGVDGYFGDSKELELFAEGYYQRGTLQHAPTLVRKEAYAFNAGARLVPCSCKKFWIEAAFSRRSGDRQSGDNRDQAFQSYENVNRFLILESAEFGLDVDSNLDCARIALGVGPFDVAGRPLRIQADVGRFTAVTPIQSVVAAGTSLQWGIESDLAFTWNYNDSFSLSLRGAWLADSELLRRIGTGGNHAWLMVFGADLKF